MKERYYSVILDEKHAYAYIRFAPAYFNIGKSHWILESFHTTNYKYVLPLFDKILEWMNENYIIELEFDYTLKSFRSKTCHLNSRISHIKYLHEHRSFIVADLTIDDPMVYLA